jgi:hypothetical protein
LKIIHHKEKNWWAALQVVLVVIPEYVDDALHGFGRQSDHSKSNWYGDLLPSVDNE